MTGVVGDELFLGPPELGFKRPQLLGGVFQPGIGQEVAEPVEERERVRLNERIGAASMSANSAVASLGRSRLWPRLISRSETASALSPMSSARSFLQPRQ
jgi:hypothetical protein